jgi:hypothetical protein
MNEKEKLSILIDSEIAREIKIESARLGITQGELISQMWSAYKARDQAQSKERDIQSADDQIEEINERAQIEMIERKKREQAEKAQRDMRIKRAKEILEDSDRFDLDMIELYARRMREIGEEKLAKELEKIAEYRR